MGRHAALEAAYNRYADMLYRIALTHTGQCDTAEDAVHDVFLRYAQREPAFTDETHERAWFIRVTVNRCIDITRRDQRRRSLPLHEQTHFSAPEEASADALLQAVHTLPPKYRSAIILHCLEELPVRETADALGISVSAVKMRLSRGRALLKSIIYPGKEEQGRV